MEFIVYVAGPIKGTTYDGCSGWREKLQDQFDLQIRIAGVDDRIRVASPLRSKAHYKGLGVLDDNPEKGLLEADLFARTIDCRRGVMTRDRFDCTRANLVFANLLGAKQVSIGTVMEIAWAHLARVPLVVVMEEGNPHWHSLLIEATDFLVDDFELGVSVATSVLLPVVGTGFSTSKPAFIQEPVHFMDPVRFMGCS